MRNKTASSNRDSLIGLEVDNETLAQLMAIARRHCKLVLEHVKASDSLSRFNSTDSYSSG